jgi:hypothetical protein
MVAEVQQGQIDGVQAVGDGRALVKPRCRLLELRWTSDASVEVEGAPMREEHELQCSLTSDGSRVGGIGGPRGSHGYLLNTYVFGDL